MGTIDPEALDAMDWLLDRFATDDAVAYAEVGALDRTKTDLVITHRGPRDAISFPQTGVFCRVYADGAADYRFTQTLTESALSDIAERAIRSGTHLAQDVPDQFDPHTRHQATHPGWSVEPLDAISTDRKQEVLQNALTATERLSTDREWVNYTDEHVDLAVGTTTGSTVRTTLDRASVECSFTLTAGPTVRRHAGSTRGAPFLDRLPDVIDDAVIAGTELATAQPIAPPTGTQQVVLSPQASGQMLLFLTRYLEADTMAMGLSPYTVGDRIAPALLTMDDTIVPGSWAARGYDAELRSTRPIRLIEDGTIMTALHSTSSAAEADTTPAGTVIPSIGFEQPPRIHARHLDVQAGTTTQEDLVADAALVIERFGDPYPVDELERTHRTSHMPASVMYAENVDRLTESRSAVGQAQLPIAEGYRLGEDGTRTGRIDAGLVDFQPEDLQTIDGMGQYRATTTATAEKHKSKLPVAATAPALRFQTTIAAED